MNVPNQRIVYLNGEFVPESEAKIPFRDRGVKFGDAVFDTTSYRRQHRQTSHPYHERGFSPHFRGQIRHSNIRYADWEHSLAIPPPR